MDISELAGKFGADGMKERLPELEKLGGTDAAREMRRKYASQGDSIRRAMASGDAAALEEAIKGLLSTKEGAELSKKLGEMMK